MFDFTQLPQANPRRIAIHVKASAQRAIRQGHPWLFDQAIRKQSHAGQSGDLAVIFDDQRRFLAIGLYDPDSPIRVRILHHHSPATIDEAWFRARIEKALAQRQHLPAEGTTGYRAIYGEGDGLPALILDRYADTWVLKLYSTAWIVHLKTIVDAVQTCAQPKHLILRLSRNVQTAFGGYGLSDGQALMQSLPTMPLTFHENGLAFLADVIRGHKTGYFFDQRENRARVRDMAQGRRVLDVFAYNGGFSVHASAGGASAVTSLDISAPALEQARANMHLNSDLTAHTDHQIVIADAFEALQRLRDASARYDVVIVDPPAFAKSADEVDKALQAYERLARLAVPLVAQGGHLVMASCSSRVTADAFFNLIERVLVDLHRPSRHIAYTHHAIDHPVTFAEGAYLKCLFADL